MRLGSRLPIFLASLIASLVVAALSTAGAYAYLMGVPAVAAAAEFPAIAAAIVALVAILLSLGLARMSGMPFGRIVLAARRFTAGDFSVRALGPGGSPAEGGLAGTFNAALEAAQAKISEVEAACLDRNQKLEAALSQLEELEEQKRRDAKVAHRMQRRIVPRQGELPTRRELVFHALYAPAENTGGDFIDAVRAGKNGCAFIAADVSGRGVTSALMAAIVKNAFRSKSGWGAEAGKVLAEVNGELLPILSGSEHFVSAAFAALDLESGRLSYALAGHPPPLLLRRREFAIVELQAEGPSLGVLEGAEYETRETRLEEGDRLLFYTDGVTSARNYQGASFGRDRLSRVFADSGQADLSRFPTALATELESFTVGGPRADDLVILAGEFVAYARGEGPRRLPSETEDYRALAKRGARLAQAGEVEEAIRVYERVLSLEPEDAKALNNLGTLYWRLGKREEAAVRFREAARLEPEDPRISRNLGLAERVARKN